MFPFERGQHFPVDWSASVSNILTVRKWADPKIVGRNFTSRIRPMYHFAPESSPLTISVWKLIIAPWRVSFKPSAQCSRKRPDV